MTWIYFTGGSDSIPVDRALIRGDREMLVESTWDGYHYTVPLSSTDGIRFTADFPCKTGADTWNVRATCKLWANSTGYLLLGTWIEAGEEMHWIVELYESNNKPSMRCS